MTVKEVIENFYNGLTNKNDQWQTDLADDVVFSDSSKKLHAEGKEAFIQSFSGFLRAVEKIELKQLIIEDENAAAVVGYDYKSPTGSKMHQDDAEVWKIIDGKIASLIIYFDITEFRTFMGR